MTLKYCAKCKTGKDLDEYYSNRSRKDGLQQYCKTCFREYQSTGERKKQQRVYRFNSATSIKRREYLRSWQLMKKYGITIDEYKAMLTEQKSCCAICAKHRVDCLNGLYVDHDHITGQVRQLLCRECNAGLGHYQEKPELLRKAALYLERHSKKLKLVTK